MSENKQVAAVSCASRCHDSAHLRAISERNPRSENSKFLVWEPRAVSRRGRRDHRMRSTHQERSVWDFIEDSVDIVVIGTRSRRESTRHRQRRKIQVPLGFFLRSLSNTTVAECALQLDIGGKLLEIFDSTSSHTLSFYRRRKRRKK